MLIPVSPILKKSPLDINLFGNRFASDYRNRLQLNMAIFPGLNDQYPFLPRVILAQPFSPWW